MEAALRDYSNSFNSLQSVNQVWHPIILLRPPRLGMREGGEERSSVQLTAPPSNPESHELCGTAAAERILAWTDCIAKTVTQGGVVDAGGGTELCRNTT